MAPNTAGREGAGDLASSAVAVWASAVWAGDLASTVWPASAAAAASASASASAAAYLCRPVPSTAAWLPALRRLEVRLYLRHHLGSAGGEGGARVCSFDDGAYPENHEPRQSLRREQSRPACTCTRPSGVNQCGNSVPQHERVAAKLCSPAGNELPQRS
eukprot:COSAG02_NODE_1558_length_11928_cov_4.044974_2_plen_159_part_00